MGSPDRDGYGGQGIGEDLPVDRHTRGRGVAMKIRSASANNHRKVFEVRLGSRVLAYPYSRTDPQPSPTDTVQEIIIDPEVGREAFWYVLRSGARGYVHAEQVLDYNQDPSYMRDQRLYRLTVETQHRVKASPLSTREIIRRLGTSATQFYRLIDQTNYRKSLDQLLSFLQVLDCHVAAALPDPAAPYPFAPNFRLVAKGGAPPPPHR